MQINSSLKFHRVTSTAALARDFLRECEKQCALHFLLDLVDILCKFFDGSWAERTKLFFRDSFILKA